MSKLDRYIIGKFLGTFAFMLGVFCLVVVVFDLMERLGRLIEHDAPLWDAALYYVNVCFHFAALLMGFVVFLTIIWFTSRLAQNSEIIAMLAGGMPFRRLFRPYFIASGLLLGMSLVLNHSVVPRSNEQKLAFEQSFINKAIHVKDRNLYREVAPGTIAYFRSVNYGRRTGYKFQLEQWDDDVLSQRIIAAKATYLAKDSLWRLVNVGVRDFQEDGSQRYRYLSRLDTTLAMTVDDFAERDEVVATMPTRRLAAYIDEVQQRGADSSNLELTLHGRTANAAAILVLTLIGVSIAARRLRGGTGLHLFAAVVIGFTYIFASKVITVWAAAVGLPAWFPINEYALRFIAAWLPNVLFAALGLWLYVKAPK